MNYCNICGKELNPMNQYKCKDGFICDDCFHRAKINSDVLKCTISEIKKSVTENNELKFIIKAKNPLKHKKIIIVSILITIGVILLILIDDYLYDQKANQYIGSKMNETFHNMKYSTSDTTTNSKNSINDEYKFSEFLCDKWIDKYNEYISDGNISNSELNILIEELDGLIEEINDDTKNSSSSLFGYGSNDTLSDFSSKLLESTNNAKSSIISTLYKMANSETINQSDKAKIDKDINFLKDMCK